MANSNGELLERLAGSAAVRSLETEQRLVKLLQRKKWVVTHGSFYPDPTTGKLRELDIVAKAYWRRQFRGRTQGIQIELHAEVKSIRDFHLVFAPLANGRLVELAPREWIGYHEKRLAEALDRGGANASEIAVTMKWFENACATRDGRIRVHKLFVDPPPSWFPSSAFRETNVGGDKDLDSSVLWRAIQSVFGSTESSRAAWLDNTFNNVRDLVAFARRIRRSVCEVVAQELGHSPGYVCLYHPVVFVESHVWSSAQGALKERDWCRFFRLGPDWPELWCDVVNVSAAEKYVRQLTAFYSMQMQRLNARR